MGGDAMKKKRAAAFWRQKQYVIAGTLIILAVIGLTWFYTGEQTKERARKEQELAKQAKELEEQVALTQEETEEQVEAVSSFVAPEAENEKAEVASLEEEEQPEEEKEEPAKETTNVAETLHFSAEDGLSWPMQGDVILNYSMNQTVYFATLDQYKYNPGVVIAGNVNDKVYAVAKGQITHIANNEETGCTMTMDLGDGYTATYGQLKELNFKEGDYVEEGQVVGYVSEPTKYFAVEGSNLYFEIDKDGVPQDPVTMFQ